MPLPQWFEKTHSQPHSIELQRAKDGVYYWSIKQYHGDDEADDALIALDYIDQYLWDHFIPAKEAPKEP